MRAVHPLSAEALTMWWSRC